MQIHCPNCSTAIDITEDHLGQKGRCVTCDSTFIITEPPGDDPEAIPLTPAEPAPPAVEQSPAAVAKPKLKVPATSSRPPVSYVPRKKSSVGTLFILLCLGGAGAYVYFKFFAEADSGRPLASAQSDTAANTTPSEQVPAAPVDDDTLTFDLPPAPEGSAQPPALPEEQRARALAFLKSDQPKKRSAAYTALRKLGDPYKDLYAELLDEAREHHLKTFADKTFAFSSDENSLSSFQSAYDDWRKLVIGARKTVQTNWKSANKNNNKAKRAEMDRTFDDVADLYRKLVKASEQAGQKEINSLNQQVKILAKITTEQAWCDGDDEPAAPQPVGELITEAGGADDFGKTLETITRTANAIRDRTDAARHNRDCSWADSAYREFATLLNDRRAALGLRSLRLDAALSKSCGEHSSDMFFGNYFSHKGTDGSTFSARAKRGGFTGNAIGECIYNKSTSASATHEAWWYSDIHRLILYASAPNTLGLGTAQSIWVLNTGKRDW